MEFRLKVGGTTPAGNFRILPAPCCNRSSPDMNRNTLSSVGAQVLPKFSILIPYVFPTSGVEDLAVRICSCQVAFVSANARAEPMIGIFALSERPQRSRRL